MDNSVENSDDTSLLGEDGFVDVSFSNIDQRIDEYEGGTTNGDVVHTNKNIFQSAATVDEGTGSKETCDEILKKYSQDTQICSKKTDSLLENESVTVCLDESGETVLTEKCTDVLGSRVTFQSDGTVSAINVTNGESQSDEDMYIQNLKTINGADVEVSLILDCSDTEGRTTETKDTDLDKNEFKETILATAEGILDNSSLCSLNEGRTGDLTPQNVENVDTSSVLPFFDKMCDNDLETNTSSNLHASDENIQTDRPMIAFDLIRDDDLENNANLHEADEYYFCKDVISSQIPNFEMLQNDTHETTSIRSSGFEDRNVIDLLKDIKNDLINRSDNDDYGLAQLFEESHLGAKLCVKSKSARKRKKQQLKHRKLVTSQKSEKSRRQFAQSFQELQSSKIVFDDHDIDTSITCPVCLEMYHMPNTCNPCSHMFCDPCLRRLTGQGSEGIPCPLCRTVISSCELNKDFDEYLLLEHPDIYTARAMLERHTKFRHFQLPYTAPLPLGKRLMRQLIASRNSQSDTRWMSHDWFKFLLGCTAGMCLSLLIMLFNRVKSVRDARDVNIVFLSIIIGAFLTFLIFKYMKI